MMRLLSALMFVTLLLCGVGAASAGKETPRKSAQPKAWIAKDLYFQLRKKSPDLLAQFESQLQSGMAKDRGQAGVKRLAGGGYELKIRGSGARLFGREQELTLPAKRGGKQKMRVILLDRFEAKHQ